MRDTIISLFVRFSPTNIRLGIRLGSLFFLLFLSSLFLLPQPLFAAAVGDAPHIDGSKMGLLWIFPFVGILLSIAVFPLVAPHFWEENFGKISGFWAILFLAPFAYVYGWELALFETLHVGLLEYIPFIALLFSLFTISGGVRVTGSLSGTPVVNTLILLTGTFIASWMGTTGAAILLIRPLLRANASRRYSVHTYVFFIFLVANIGGSLTPLGDPPLFLGFLNGIDFFWPMKHMFLPMLFLSACLLVLYFLVESFMYRRENKEEIKAKLEKETQALGLDGGINLLFLLGVILAVSLSGFFSTDSGFTLYHVHVTYSNFLRDISLAILAFLSLYYTTNENRNANSFSWFPIVEVGKLFAGIFITIVPAIAILKSGTDGALGSIVRLVTDEAGAPVNAMYFWATGILSSFLDNAPTYLVFFNIAGGDAEALMGTFSKTLLAISMGAVFMGANSYIGNAPNFMVRSICEDQGVKMPSFFGYIAWSHCILIPFFILVTFIFF